MEAMKVLIVICFWSYLQFAHCVLTGNHVCHVNETIPYNTTISYTKSLKSRITMKITRQTAFRNVTKYRTETVDVCCLGYIESDGHCAACPYKTWGPACKNECSCKEFGCDAKDGHCFCASGFGGINCTIPCDSEHFGPNCTEICKCGLNQICDSKTGNCSCSVGFTGDKCDSPCAPGFYGEHCSSVCPCDPEGTLLCKATSGECVCNVGFEGANCSQSVTTTTLTPLITATLLVTTTMSTMPTVQLIGTIEETTTMVTSEAHYATDSLATESTVPKLNCDSVNCSSECACHPDGTLHCKAETDDFCKCSEQLSSVTCLPLVKPVPHYEDEAPGGHDDAIKKPDDDVTDDDHSNDHLHVTHPVTIAIYGVLLVMSICIVGVVTYLVIGCVKRRPSNEVAMYNVGGGSQGNLVSGYPRSFTEGRNIALNYNGTQL